MTTDRGYEKLKENEFSDLFDKETELVYVTDCAIETDMEVMLPSEYVSSTAERISLYTELDHIKTEERLMEFTNQLIDRFGPIPKPVNDLLNTVRLRWIAKDLGFEKIALRDNLMTAHFVSNQESPYYETETYQQVMQYIINHPKRCALKQTESKLILTMKEVSTVTQALEIVRAMGE